MSKNFGKDFDNILNLARSRDAFCFTRFSDGEVTILRNQPLILGDGFFLQGDIHGNLRIAVPRQTYSEEEQKRFIPEESPFIYEKLTEAFKYRKKNYFKGIPPQNSLDGSASWNFCIDLYGSGDEEHLTFSNVLINDNYRRFISEMLPVFKDKKVVLVSNKNSRFENLPFSIVKHFPVGTNCMVNDYSLVETCGKWIEENDIKDHLFLFSAASLSNFLGYELYKKFDNNQYMDIGSSLGPLLGLSGWKTTRSYLNSYWSNPANPPRQQVDVWI